VLDHFIECPRFGGRRPATACVHFDRYKVCRRYCDSLRAYLKSHPGFVEKTKEVFAAAENVVGTTGIQLDLIPSKHSGKHVPDPELACTLCRFVAKSARGLKSHRTRSHRKTGG
jgi:hypothetical protein